MRERTYRLLALLALLALVAAACGGDTGDVAETDDPVATDTPAPDEDGTTDPAPTDDGEETTAPPEGGDDVLVYGTLNPPGSIDPAKCYDSACSAILNNTTESLVWFPPGSDTVEPALAEEYEVSEDGLTYTFTLREGVTFHDGSELDADDVVFSLQRSVDLNHPQGAAFLISSIESMEATDERTVVVTIAEPNITFLSRLNYTVAAILPSDGDAYPVPDAAIDVEDPDAAAAEADEFVNEATIVGTGPYEMTDYQEGVSVTLERNENYWGDAPAIPTVRIQYFSDSAQLSNALTTGEVDLVLNDLAPAERTSAESAEGVAITQSDGGRIRYLVVNVNEAPFDDVNVRRAIAATVDRQRIIDEVFEGAGVPLYSMIPQAFDVNADYISDIEVPELSGTPIDITLWYPTNRYGDTEADVAETIGRSLGESGLFNVTTEGADWASEYAPNLSTGTYGLFTLGWYPDYIDPDDYIEPFYDSEDTFLGYYANPAMDELITAEQQETDLDARAGIFDEIQQLAAEDMPLIPLYEEGTTIYHSEAVGNVEATLDAAQQLRFYVFTLG